MLLFSYGLNNNCLLLLNTLVPKGTKLQEQPITVQLAVFFIFFSYNQNISVFFFIHTTAVQPWTQNFHPQNSVKPLVNFWVIFVTKKRRLSHNVIIPFSIGLTWRGSFFMQTLSLLTWEKKVRLFFFQPTWHQHGGRGSNCGQFCDVLEDTAMHFYSHWISWH